MNAMSGKNDDLEYASEMRRRYSPLVAQYGHSFRAVDWGSEVGQLKRFEVLLAATDFENASILDVGCGLGHLVEYLEFRGFKGKYLGVDIVPEMIEKAQAVHKNAEFKLIDCLGDLDGIQPDFVVASGVFAFADKDRFHATIQRLFAITGKVLAVNSLSSWSDTAARNEFHADPVETFRFCGGLTKKVMLRHDYFPHDFSVYLYKA